MNPAHTTRTRRRTAVIAGALGLGLALVGVIPAAAAPTVGTVTLGLSATTLEIGDTVTATATLPATTDVFAYEVTFAFDAELFEYVDDSATGPDGGFDAVTEGDGTITVTHTRLGTSPALSGDLVVTADFEAISDGETTIEIPAITLVDSESATTPLEDAASAEVTIEADEVVVPSPSPSPSASAGAGDGEGGPLAFTGSTLASNIAIIVVVALAALTLGFVLVRRRIAGTR
ncbi:hypothetical protein M2152_000572 [Microbacteriaceae bacterium SG_E_30_P1]|uniref:Cohesin domain-containing protein n=1 Tax=Antiquaquibacter oligotrophicus TaxID=2880260 RepID=A0ABT6KK65_9MICO|nr:cohesin domain-containing protein [Antiquaquibacter oligotrophicus]MDH6180390.1 hypothetical protein [Antiquaquibacter oligotrophicus]UDF13869.1 cohesin domain-containing protein [Antiquaquibacter oligotrophicus]